MRVGFGYDVHRLVEGRPMIIGGVSIPFEKGLDGHSDADVLLHAVIDALIGAACLGDIGRHFPPTAAAFKDASSIDLLKKTGSMIAEAGYEVVNIDSTIVCQSPRLAPFIPKMAQAIASTLGLGEGDVNVKAKTEEGLGFTGSGDGVSSYAVALVRKKA